MMKVSDRNVRQEDHSDSGVKHPYEVIVVDHYENGGMGSHNEMFPTKEEADAYAEKKRQEVDRK